MADTPIERGRGVQIGHHSVNTFAPAVSTCPDCGWFHSDCQCFGDEEDDEAACSHCGGEGTCESGCDPGWYDDIHPCHACKGSGLAKDQVIF